VALAAVALAATLHFPVITGFVAYGVIIAYSVTLAVVAVASGAWYVAIVGALMVAFQLLLAYQFYLFRHMAAALLGTLRTVAARHQGIWATLAVSMVVTLLWSALFAALLPPAFVVFTGPAAYVVYVYYSFTYFWVAQVIGNVFFMTMSGSVASWYFATSDADTVAQPTLGAARRALTYSFGSICFGSLLVALLQTLRRVLSIVRRANTNNVFIAVLACIADCILGCIEYLLRFFNKYVYVIIASYGVSYCTGAKKTLSMLGPAGFSMIVNHNVVVAIAFASYLAAAITCAVAGYGLAVAALPIVELRWPTAALGAALGGFIVSNSFAVPDAGATTLLVNYLCAPGQLRVRDADAFARFDSAMGSPDLGAPV